MTKKIKGIEFGGDIKWSEEKGDCDFNLHKMTKLEKWMEEVKNRCEKATEGPWRFKDDGFQGQGEILTWHHTTGRPIVSVMAGWGYTKKFSDVVTCIEDAENGQFISNARIDLPKALRIIERMREALEVYAGEKYWGNEEKLQKADSWNIGDRGALAVICLKGIEEEVGE